MACFRIRVAVPRASTLASGIALLAVALVLGGCKAQPRYDEEDYARKLQALQGRHIDEIKRAWGPAEADDKLAGGGRMITFKRMMPAFLAPTLCRTTFEVGPDDRIVRARFAGAGCRTRPSDDLGLNPR